MAPGLAKWAVERVSPEKVVGPLQAVQSLSLVHPTPKPFMEVKSPGGLRKRAEDSLLNQTRTRTVGLYFPSVGALVTLIGVAAGGPALAQPSSPWLEVSNGQATPVRPEPKPADAEPARPAAAAEPEPEAEPVKVHGTITVDFEKVTIAELLRLTKTLEQVDGVIHIVSARGGEGDDRAVVTISRPGSPALILGEEGAVERARAQATLPTASSREPERPAATPFPRLASLGRLLGLNQRHPAATPEVETGPMAVTWEPRPSALGSENVARTSYEPPTFEPPTFEPLSPLKLDSAEVEPAPAPASALSPAPAPTAEPEEAAPAPTSEAEAGPQAQAAGAPRKHVATADDSFEGLSRSFYGDARYARALWWANRGEIAWPGALTAGKRIMIPAPGELEPRMIVGPDPVGVASAPKPKPEPAEGRFDPAVRPVSFTEPAQNQDQDQDEGGFPVHVVRPDDTLRLIAREICGDERKALEIIALNRDILTPEGRIRVGQRLLLPAAVEKPEP